MKLIRPIEVTDTVLTASNVVETAPALYNSGTTYALGGSASVAGTHNALAVYQSLQGSNTNHAPATSPTWWKHTGDTYGVYSSLATYAADDRVIDPTSHHEFRSVVGSNTGQALTDATKWQDMGLNNRWRLFDELVQTQTTNPDSIAMTLVMPGRADSVALLNTSAASVHVTMTDATDGVVYDRTFSMISDGGVTDWYAWFFEPIERLADLVLTDMLPYAGATLGITLTDAAQTVGCGACVIGLSKDIGGTQYGATVGIQDYSVKSTNEFGDYVVVERAYAKRGSFTVWVASGLVDRLASLLASYRATPIVYVGDGDYGATAIYGFYKDFGIDIAYPDVAACTLEIEGLT